MTARRAKNRPIKKRIAFAVLAIFGFFLLVEVVFRIIFPGITGRQPFWQFDNPHLEMSSTYDHDPVLFWKLKPDNPGYQVNSYGYRGVPVGPTKESGDIRIICLGDSCTFGLGPSPIPADKTYAALLQKGLSEKLPGKKITVLNFGCPGYTSFQGKLLLKRKGLKYDPDVVTAYFGINDSFPAIGFSDSQQRPMVEPPAIPGPVQSILRHSAVHELMVRMIYGARLKVKKADGNTERVPLPEYHENLDAIARMGTDNGFATYFIDPPYLDAQGVVQRSDGNMHDPRIDIYTPFADAQLNGAEPIFGAPDNVHPTIEGHRIAADAIAEKLLRDKPWLK